MTTTAARRSPPPTLAETLAAGRGLPPSAAPRILFARSLYPHARLLAPLMILCGSDNFAPDMDFVLGACRLRSLDGFSAELSDYLHHPQNRGFLRRVLRLRISVARLRRIVRTGLPPSHPA